MHASSRRLIGQITWAVFGISLVFPAVAAFVRRPEIWPKWWGAVDVCLAFLLALLGVLVQSLSRDQVDAHVKELSYRAYRVLLHGILAMLLLFFVAGNRIKWDQCLTGFAWRAWLLAYCLPSWVAVFQPSNKAASAHEPEGSSSRL